MVSAGSAGGDWDSQINIQVPPRFRGATLARRAAINLNEPLRRCHIRRKKAGLKKRNR